LAPGGGVRDACFVCQGCDDLVAAMRRLLGDALRLLRERGEEERPPGIEGGATFDRDTQGFDGAGEAEDEKTQPFASPPSLSQQPRLEAAFGRFPFPCRFLAQAAGLHCKPL